MSKNIEERIKNLAEWDVAYENGNPIVSDEIYDLEKDEVRRISPEHDYFKNVGGLSEENHGWQQKYTHKYPMGSLQKDKSPEETEDWVTKSYPDTKGLKLLLQPKLDGSSVCVIYVDKQLDRIVSRGNGIVGYDITQVAKHIKDIPSKISEKGYVEIKGECLKDKESFYKTWAPQGYNDPRSFVPGTLNSQPDENTASDMKEIDISFITYEVRGKTFATETEKMQFLRDNKFKTLKDSTLELDCTGKTHKQIVDGFKKYMDGINRKKFAFQLDGIVVKNDDILASEKLGIVNLRPKGSRAIKFPCEQKEAIIEGIQWETGKSGVVTPVAILKPVFLSGATISRATLHNIKEIARLGIDRLPYKVILIRSGDIIPKVIKGVEPMANAKKIVFPNECPCCSEPLFWDKTQTNKVCLNINCVAQLSGKIDYYLKTLGIKGIGSSTIDTLIDKGYVKSLSDMYGLSQYKNELADVFGDRASANILESMSSVDSVSLATFVKSLSIANIGRMSEELVNVAPSVKDLDNLKEEDIVAIHGFGSVKSHCFVTEWKSQRSEIDKLLKYIIIKKEVVMAKKGKIKLDGKSFLITGKLSMGRKEFEKIIEENGGRNASGVSKNLDFLIVGEDSGSKKPKAEALGVKIISEDEFNAML